MDENKKNTITDKEGAEIYLDALKIAGKDNSAAEDKIIPQKKYGRLLKIAAVVASIVIVLAVISSAVYNFVIDYRSKEVRISHISTAVADYEKHIKSGPSVTSNFEGAMKYADSLLNVLDVLIEDFPQEDTLKEMWSSVAIHKYERYIHYSLKSNLYDNIVKIDSKIIQKAKQYGTKYVNVLPIMLSLTDFYKYKTLYPEPPILASVVPQQWLVKDLVNKSKLIIDSLNNNSVVIEVHFPNLYNWIKYVSNSIFPEIFQWNSFWSKYRKIMSNEKSLENQKQFAVLVEEFPNLTILKNKEQYQLENISKISIGLCNKSIVPPGKSLDDEWLPIAKYLKTQFGFDVSLNYFDSYFDLFSAFSKSEVDMALFDIPSSTISYNANVGIPIAMRMWNQTSYVKDMLFSTDGTALKPEQIQGKKIGLLSNDYYYLYDYYTTNHLSADSLFLNIVSVNSLDSLADMINNNIVELAALNKEEFYYLRYSGALKKQLKMITELGSSPLAVLWVRESLPAEFIKSLQNIFIAMVANMVFPSYDPVTYHPYADWDIYDIPVMAKYYDDTRNILLKYSKVMNRLNLLPIVAHHDSVSVPLRNALISFLEMEGFAVVEQSQSSKKPADKSAPVVSLETKAINDSLYEYAVKIHKYDGGNKKLLYHDVFLDNKGKVPPDFKMKLFDISGHLSVRGNVNKVVGDTLFIALSIDPKLLVGRKVKLIQKDNILTEKPSYYGEGRICDFKHRTIKVITDNKTAKAVRIGDVAEIVK